MLAAAVTTVDSGLGNVGSIANMLRRIETAVSITSDPDATSRATKSVLPGVGAFDAETSALRERHLDVALQDADGEEGSTGARHLPRPPDHDGRE